MTSAAEPAPRRVRGELFADYVRMVRHQKSVDWARHLSLEDYRYLRDPIDANAWYPMDSFERLGNAILAEIARGDLQAVRAWGFLSAFALAEKHRALVAANDPLESLMRFRVMRATFFDFEAIDVSEIGAEHATLAVRYYMGDVAEEAACYQTAGFFENVLIMSGAKDVSWRFLGERWSGADTTTIDFSWT